MTTTGLNSHWFQSGVLDITIWVLQILHMAKLFLSSLSVFSLSLSFYSALSLQISFCKYSTHELISGKKNQALLSLRSGVVWLCGINQVTWKVNQGLYVVLRWMGTLAVHFHIFYYLCIFLLFFCVSWYPLKCNIFNSFYCRFFLCGDY